MKNWFPLLFLVLFAPAVSAQQLLVANQGEHTLVIVDPASRKVISTVGVDINGHEVIASPDGRYRLRTDLRQFRSGKAGNGREHSAGD